jgi:proteic killer suppression protein
MPLMSGVPAEDMRSRPNPYLPGPPCCLTLNVTRYILRAVIRSFRSKETEKIFRREFSRRFHSIARVSKRKLDHLQAATSLRDLAVVPGNHLETLSGNRSGQYSIRVNEQWRICFEWRDGDVHSAEIVDYH